MVKRWQRDLGQQVWEAKTATEARAIIAVCEQRFRGRPVAVGRENNIGTINIASDSGLALVERLTNGLDSFDRVGGQVEPSYFRTRLAGGGWSAFLRSSRWRPRRYVRTRKEVFG